MSKISSYMLSSIFIDSLMRVESSDRLHLRADMSSLSEDERANINTRFYFASGFKRPVNDYLTHNKGYVKFSENNNGRIITDEVKYFSDVKLQDYDSVMISTRFQVKRQVEGETHDLPAIRDGLYLLPYCDGEEEFLFEEFFIMIDNGKRVLHYSELSPEFETYYLNERGNMLAGIDTSTRKIFDHNEFDYNDPALGEIYELLHDDNGVSLLLKGVN